MSKALQELVEISRNRPIELQKAKEQGKKIIEYTGSFIPEQMIYASGAEPYLMCRGGEPEPPEAVLPYMLRFMNPLARSQAGYHLLGIDPVTPIADLIVAQQTECHVGRISELMEYLDLPIFKVGVPPDWDKSFATDYYHNALLELKGKLEEITGNEITNEKLKDYIIAINKINELLRKIDELRKKDSPKIGGYDFIRLNHYTFMCDPETSINKLEELYDELKKCDEEIFSKDAPRILIAGRAVAIGDYVVPKLVEDCGGVIVTEMLDEGIRHFKWDVETEGDLIENITKTYYLEKTPPNIFQPSWKKRFEFMKQLISDYKVDAVIWYQLSFDEIYNLESACVAKWLQEMEMPFLKLESSYEYSRESMGPLTTRMESFIKSIQK